MSWNGIRLLLNACLKKKATCVVAISASFDFNPYRSLLVICFEVNGMYMFALMTKSLSRRLLTGSSCWWTNIVKEMACYKSGDKHHKDESLTKRISPSVNTNLCCTIKVFIQQTLKQQEGNLFVGFQHVATFSVVIEARKKTFLPNWL